MFYVPRNASAYCGLTRGDIGKYVTQNCALNEPKYVNKYSLLMQDIQIETQRNWYQINNI